MSIQRFIHPSIWRSEQVCSLPQEAQLLFIGCFSTADDEGRRKASALSLKADIFPLVEWATIEKIEAWTRQVADKGLIRVYSGPDGTLYLDLPKWSEYQRPKYKKSSKLPKFNPESAHIWTGPGPDMAPIGAESGQGLGRVGLGRTGLGRVGKGREQASEASGLPAAVTGKTDEEKPTKSQLPRVSDAAIKTLCEFGEACSIKRSVVCQLLKKHAPDWLLGWMLYQLQQKPANPVGYLHSCLKQRKTPPDDLYARARKLIEDAEATTDKPPPVNVGAVAKPADTMPEGGSMNERRNAALDVLEKSGKGNTR